MYVIVNIVLELIDILQIYDYGLDPDPTGLDPDPQHFIYYPPPPLSS